MTLRVCVCVCFKEIDRERTYFQVVHSQPVNCSKFTIFLSAGVFILLVIGILLTLSVWACTNQYSRVIKSSFLLSISWELFFFSSKSKTCRRFVFIFKKIIHWSSLFKNSWKKICRFQKRHLHWPPAVN